MSKKTFKWVATVMSSAWLCGLGVLIAAKEVSRGDAIEAWLFGGGLILLGILVAIAVVYNMADDFDKYDDI